MLRRKRRLTKHIQKGRGFGSSQSPKAHCAALRTVLLGLTISDRVRGQNIYRQSHLSARLGPRALSCSCVRNSPVRSYLEDSFRSCYGVLNARCPERAGFVREGGRNPWPVRPRAPHGRGACSRPGWGRVRSQHGCTPCFSGGLRRPQPPRCGGHSGVPKTARGLPQLRAGPSASRWSAFPSKRGVVTIIPN